jgi:hypothetical protein
MKKSWELVALPYGVTTEILPEPVLYGTAVVIVVVEEELTDAVEMLNLRMLFAGLVSKLVPEIVTAVPGVPMAGVNPLMVGAPVVEVTVNTALLVAEPVGVVTPIAPVVAPAGTLVVICVAVEEFTVAATPLNVTEFWLGVVL